MNVPPSPQPRPGPRQFPEAPRLLPAQKKFEWWYWGVITSLVALLMWGLVTSQWRILFEGPWIAGLGTVVMALIVIRKYAKSRIARRFLNPHQGFLCPSCHYPMRGLPNVGHCPECGIEYSRARIVELWERTYGITGRFPRSEVLRSPTACMPPDPGLGLPPWTKGSLNAAAEKIESIARKNGHSAPRYAAYALDVAQAGIQLGRPVPPELFAFLSRIDPAMWSRFVGVTPAPVAASDGNDPIASFAGESMVDVIAIRSPAELRVVETPAVDPRKPLWSVAFADACNGMVVVYAAPDDRPNGQVLAVVPGTAKHLWLADSLAQWLSRLAACEGADPALSPRGIDGIPAALREMYTAEFQQRNPIQTTLTAESTA
ncbi:MAG: hypothetical protein U0637_10950 [Phycisphaerales bacterium]